jgi:hypothetical protein
MKVQKKWLSIGFKRLSSTNSGINSEILALYTSASRVVKKWCSNVTDITWAHYFNA